MTTGYYVVRCRLHSSEVGAAACSEPCIMEAGYNLLLQALLHE